MASWLKALTRTREAISGALDRVFNRVKVDPATLEELEEALIKSDIAPRLAAEIVAELGRDLRGKKDVDPLEALKERLRQRFSGDRAFNWAALPAPAIILVIGVNGSGKTTTCAKLAHLAKTSGRRPLLGAADTFRAAGTEQLRLWAERLGCEVVSGRQGSDAAAVAFDTVEAATARGMDLAIIDTAGRMHTKAPLMEELRKMARSITKRDPTAPHEVWMILDASIGQNALHQARQFNEAIPLTGVVITKLDGSSKAGFLFSVKQELNVPILFAGLGETAADLVAFNAAEFVEGMFDGAARGE